MKPPPHKSVPVPKVLTSTCPACDASGSQRRRPRGLRLWLPVSGLAEDMWQLQTLWSCKASSATSSQRESTKELLAIEKRAKQIFSHLVNTLKATCAIHTCDAIRVVTLLQNSSLTHAFSLSRKNTVWVWIRGVSQDIPDKAGFVESTSPPWRNGGRDKQEVCTQMALGMPGQWRTTSCAQQYHFFCQNDLTGKI